jgi:hypothetical protein
MKKLKGITWNFFRATLGALSLIMSLPIQQ